MITTGIIRQININSDENHKNNIYKVEIGILQAPTGANPEEYYVLASACVSPGMYQPYKVGDKVFIGFINNEVSLPVILGKIYKGTDENEILSSCYAYMNSLKVDARTELSTNTKIGELTYDDLMKIYNFINSIQYFKNNEVIIGSADGKLIGSGISIGELKNIAQGSIEYAETAGEAYSVNASGIYQTSGDVLVLNAGTSTDVI